MTDLFRLPCFPSYDPGQQQRIMTYLRRHRRAVRGWIKVVLGQGGDDPWATVQARMREVLLRTDLWSDQILVLRAVQTLTMLDVQHNCDLVWSLGGYTRPDTHATAEDDRGTPADRGPDDRRASDQAELASSLPQGETATRSDLIRRRRTGPANLTQSRTGLIARARPLFRCVRRALSTYQCVPRPAGSWMESASWSTEGVGPADDLAVRLPGTAVPGRWSWS